MHRLCTRRREGQSWHRVSEMPEPALTTPAPTPSHRLFPSGRQSINAKFLLCARPVVGAGDDAKQDRLPALRESLFSVGREESTNERQAGQ